MGIPYIKKVNGQSILMVHEQPFVMLSGEVHNSSSSTIEYMKSIWERLQTLKLNSVLLPITWQLVEPVEGRFEYGLVDGLIAQARQHNMKIGFLWFGSWKNAQCSYVPEWVKLDKERFKRAEVEKGKKFVQIRSFHNMPYATLSAFCKATMKADANAFGKLMEHIKEIDGEENTVVMVQVENETGLLGSARDNSEIADKFFVENVPEGLTDYLQTNKETLAEDIRAELQNGKGQGTWKEVFGAAAEEIFSAYYTASYVNEIAKVGKEVYPLPMAVNSWLAQGGQPGQYPSGGPVARVMEVWKFAAPNIDIYAPDIYVQDFCDVCEEYSKMGNPLFIPETAGHVYAGIREVYVVGRHHAMCYAPFGIENLGITQSYDMGEQMGIDVTDPALKFSQDVEQYARFNEILTQLMPLLTSKYGTTDLQAVIKENTKNTCMDFDQYGFVVHFDFPFIKVKEGVCLVVKTDKNEFMIVGCGCLITAISLDPNRPYMEYLSIEEGYMEGDTWHMIRKLNGDEEMLKINQPTVLKIKINTYN